MERTGKIGPPFTTTLGCSVIADPPVPAAEEVERTLAELRVALASPQKRQRPKDVLEMDYQTQYLRTKLWREIKQRVLTRDNHVCQSCGGKGNYVHHLAYSRDVLEGSADHLLATVCSGCHDLIHFDEHGRSRDLQEVNRILSKGIKQTDIPEPTINLNRIMPLEVPEQWRRMTSLQQELWHKRAQEIWRERLAARKKRVAKRTRAT